MSDIRLKSIVRHIDFYKCNTKKGSVNSIISTTKSENT